MERRIILSVEGKVAIVTGAAAGARAAFAHGLAAEGARVVVADVKDCGSVATAIVANNGVAHPTIVDVRDESSMAALMGETENTFGRLDILVNNAAVGSNTPPIAIKEIPVALWDDTMAVNIRGTFLCICVSSLPQEVRSQA
jgi:NAD(P)-dependent dehydrogenase (short-subunit alcohol dehydrogenase family)